MKHILTLIVTIALCGCSTPVANGPFYKKAVSDDAIEAKGNVEYRRKVTVTPTEALIPKYFPSTNGEVVSAQMIPPEIIQAGIEVIGSVGSEALKTSSEASVKLRGAAKIEVEETYKRTSN